jgi:hypothetical protein
MNAIRIALIFSLCYVALSQECREQSSRSLEETEQLTAERIGRPVNPIKGVPVKPVNPIKGVPVMPGKGKPRPQSIEEAEQLTTESTEETEQLIAERRHPGKGPGRPGRPGGGKGKPRPQSTEEADQLTAEEADDPAGALNWLYKSLRGQ